jgi:hypothetical protein
MKDRGSEKTNEAKAADEQAKGDVAVKTESKDAKDVEMKSDD